MSGFGWAKNNLGMISPDELELRGVNVFAAPNVSPGVKVVDLGDGRVDVFQEDERRPDEGYFAEFDSLERYCDRHGIPLTEVEGHVTALPWRLQSSDIQQQQRPHF